MTTIQQAAEERYPLWLTASPVQRAAFIAGAEWMREQEDRPLPTEEEIAHTLHRADCGCDGDPGLDDHYWGLARAVLALLAKGQDR